MMDPPIPAKFKTVTQKGIQTRILVDDQGYTYSSSNSKTNSTSKTWRCSKKNKKCKASVTTEDDWVVAKKRDHNHDPPENTPRESEFNLFY